MKKVLSVAMASAMVLGMGANAFAIEYNTSSKDTAEWPENFGFEGELFVTDAKGNVKKDATTALEDYEEADFAPGDVIWMPLYADDQLAYNVDVVEGKDEVDAISSIKLADTDFAVTTSKKANYYLVPGEGWYANKADADAKRNMLNMAGWVQLDNKDTKGYHPVANPGVGAWVTVPTSVDVTVNGVVESREVASVKVVVDGKTYSGTPEKVQATLDKLFAETDTNGVHKYGYSISGTVTTKKVEATKDEVSKPEVDNTDGVLLEHGQYTGNIDKHWSINLKDSTNAVEEIVEKAELYKATAKDFAKCGATPNAVYVKVTLKDEWKHVSKETVKYYVYVAENDTENKTNEVWVSGTYANNNVKTVDFTWTNNANTPAVWEAKENGTAVFDYNDVAFFTVKMYKGEKLYLDLGTAYNQAIGNDIYDQTGAEVESFYNFVTADKNFSRVGELVLVSDDDTLVPYQVDADGNLVEVDAEYVKGYQIAHTNEKVNGFKFNTKELGNYILTTEELVPEEEVEEPAEPETPAEPEEETPAPETNEKPNPNTGAEDFVGLAVSLAVVSVAAAGALALKK